MNKEKFKFIRSAAIAVIITACLTISIQSILAAWMAPTIAPPDGNVSAPVNIGLLTQIKSGIFGVTNDFYVGANTFFVDESGTGNVGIGEISPGAKLSVSGGLAIGSGYSATAVSDGNMIISSNVGIGTTTLTAKLTVDGAIRSQQICDEVGNNCRDISTGWSVNSLNAADGSPVDVVYADNSGNVGIGTTNPQTKLDVDGVIRTMPRPSATCDANTEGAIFYDSDTDDIKVCRSGGNWEKLAWQ